jgi:uncharacterized protein YprB with RNaseH-like and TPR domain
MMNNNIPLENILFLDIETVPQKPSFDELDDRMKTLWEKKADKLKKADDDNATSLYPRAGIYAEFGKIICISVGFFNGNELRIKSYYGDDEEKLLGEFATLLNRFYSGNEHLLCAHNGKEFDFPYIARRMLINRIRLPEILDIAGRKPWEIKHLDTMELWKFGDFKNYTSLDLLTAVFGIPSPKDDISGADVWKVYWQENNLERIKNYCQKDVISLARLYLAYRLEDGPEDTDIVFS